MDRSFPEEIVIDDGTSLDGLSTQILSMMDLPDSGSLNISYRRKKLFGERTLKEEGLESGALVDVTWGWTEDAYLRQLFQSRPNNISPPQSPVRYHLNEIGSHSLVGGDVSVTDDEQHHGDATEVPLAVGEPPDYWNNHDDGSEGYHDAKIGPDN